MEVNTDYYSPAISQEDDLKVEIERFLSLTSGSVSDRGREIHLRLHGPFLECHRPLIG